MTGVAAVEYKAKASLRCEVRPVLVAYCHGVLMPGVNVQRI